MLSVLAAFPTRHLLVVGDLMLDEYCRGHVERISPEAPVPILNSVGRETTLGGAANVVKNLRALGVGVSTVGVTGDDATGEQIRGMLGVLGANGDGIVHDAGRVSTRKVRFVSVEHGQQVFRFDEESARPVQDGVEERICELIRDKAPGSHAIICSDYHKGVLTERVLQAAFCAGRDNKLPVIVAPKERDMRRYKGATILMPNLREFLQLSSLRLNGADWMCDAAARLMKYVGLEALLVTQGSQGMTLFKSEIGGLRRTDIPTVAKNVYDVTGAGDTAIAGFSAALASNADHETSARIANAAAGIVVGKQGTATVSIDELRDYLSEHGLQKQDAPAARPPLHAALAGLKIVTRAPRQR